jgi:AraC family transcriptional regulator
MTQTKMKESPAAKLEAPRFETAKQLLIAGLRDHYATAPLEGSAAQWQRFIAYFGKIPGQVGRSAYGLSFLRPNGVDYLAGVEVSGNFGLPPEFTTVLLPAQRYVIFRHQGRVSELHNTCQMIAEWLPNSGLTSVKSPGAPDFFELYSEKFDPATGIGGMEVWVPVKN